MRKKIGRGLKAGHARREQWHALLAQKRLRKEIRALQIKHDLRITGFALADEVDRARRDDVLARRLNQRNTDIRNLREKYNIPDEWDGLFFVEVVLAPIYRAFTQPQEKYGILPYTKMGLKQSDGSGEDYYRVITEIGRASCRERV